MWNGSALPHDRQEPHAEHIDSARIAASALAAYTGNAPLLSDATYNYPGSVHPSIVATYQSQAMEALRRQQEQYGGHRDMGYTYPSERTNPPVYPSHDYGDAQPTYRQSDDESNAYNNSEQRPSYHAARGKPEALATALAQGSSDEAEAIAMPVSEEPDDVEASPLNNIAPKQKKTTKKKTAKSPGTPSAVPKKKPTLNTGPSLDDPVAPMTDAEYQNVKALMHQFCKVPLLAEFSRPVALLHPEASGSMLLASSMV